ncbi:heparan sulfate glucosamine 3-O-sulfotransferase 1-like, partial [Menidia menidia]
KVHFRRGLAWYRAQIPLTLQGKLNVEKTPGYFGVPQVPLGLDPRGGRGRPHPGPLPRAEEGRTVSRPSPEDKPRELLLQHHQGLLLPPTWLDSRLFWGPPGGIHVVDGDALIRDPFPELRKAERFLDLPPRINPGNFYFNTTKGFYCLLSKGHDKCLDESKGRPHAPISAQALDKLCRYFRKPNKLFFEMVGRSFSWC